MSMQPFANRSLSAAATLLLLLAGNTPVRAATGLEDCALEEGGQWAFDGVTTNSGVLIDVSDETSGLNSLSVYKLVPGGCEHLYSSGDLGRRKSGSAYIVFPEDGWYRTVVADEVGLKSVVDFFRDRTMPIGNVVLELGRKYRSADLPKISGNMSDAGSGPGHMQYELFVGSGSAKRKSHSSPGAYFVPVDYRGSWEVSLPTAAWLPGTQEYTLRMRFVDRAGNALLGEVPFYVEN